jgi:hypothetical protein
MLEAVSRYMVPKKSIWETLTDQPLRVLQAYLYCLVVQKTPETLMG